MSNIFAVFLSFPPAACPLPPSRIDTTDMQGDLLQLACAAAMIGRPPCSQKPLVEGQRLEQADSPATCETITPPPPEMQAAWTDVFGSSINSSNWHGAITQPAAGTQAAGNSAFEISSTYSNAHEQQRQHQQQPISLTDVLSQTEQNTPQSQDPNSVHFLPLYQSSPGQSSWDSNHVSISHGLIPQSTSVHPGSVVRHPQYHHSDSFFLDLLNNDGSSSSNSTSCGGQQPSLPSELAGRRTTASCQTWELQWPR